MRDGWVRTTLGAIALLNPPEPPLRDTDHFVPMDAVHTGKRWIEYTEEKRDRNGARARQGDVLFARITPCLENGKVAQVQSEIERCGGSTEFIVIRGTEKCLSDFLYFWCTLNSNREKAAKLMTGTTGRQRLSRQDLASLDFFLPPIFEQKRIVDLISSVDSYIEALQRQLENAKKSRNAVMHELLTEDGGHWEETTLGDIAKWSGGVTPSMANVEFWEGGNIPWISSGDISTYESEGTKKNVTQKALSETSLKLLPAGTVIVVVRSGILLHSLPVAILRAPATINQDIKAAQPKEIVKPEYLWFLLRYLEKELLSTCRKTGTTVQSISTEALLGTKIKLPPISEQESIIEVISALDLVTSQSEKLIIDSKNLRSGLLSDLLSGEHQIPAGYDTIIGAAS